MPIEDARIEELIDAAAALTSILADRGFDPRERRVILSLAAIQEAKRLGWRKAAIADSLNRLCDLCRIEGGHPVSWISLAARRAHASFRSRRYQPPASTLDASERPIAGRAPPQTVRQTVSRTGECR
jgi:hypothetical protein